MLLEKDGWSVVYDKAIREDGSLFFPERLTAEFLKDQLKAQGSWIFTNQYQNEIIPTDMQTFRKEWLVNYKSLPDYKTTFAFIDPAIGQTDNSDFTALAIVDVDVDGTWYLKVARRAKLTVTQQLKLVFDVNELFKPNVIGVESVAYQQALLQLINEEMNRRGVVVPVKEIKRGPDKTKQMRISALVPRFEWRRLLIAVGLYEFEQEYLKFPRGLHDDIIDAVASIEDIYYPPPKIRSAEYEPPPSDPGYERWYIEQLRRRNG